MRAVALWLALVATIASVPIGAASGWPMEDGGAAHTLNAGLSAEPRSSWSAEIPLPVSHGDHVILTGIPIAGAGNEVCAWAVSLACYDVQTGSLVWTAMDHVPGSPHVSADEGFAISDGLVVAHPGFSPDSSAENRGTFAFDLRTGRQVWATPGGARFAAGVVISQGFVAFVDYTGGLYVLSEHDGTLIWKAQVANQTSTSPAFASDRIVVADHDGSVKAFRTEDGQLLWNDTFPSGFPPSPTIEGNSVLVGDINGVLRSIDVETGRVLWTKNLPGKFFATAPPAAQGSRVVAVTANENATYVTGLDRDTGEIAWAATHAAEFTGPPQIIGNVSVVQLGLGSYLANDIATGHRLPSDYYASLGLKSFICIGDWFLIPQTYDAANYVLVAVRSEDIFGHAWDPNSVTLATPSPPLPDHAQGEGSPTAPLVIVTIAIAAAAVVAAIVLLRRRNRPSSRVERLLRR